MIQINYNGQFVAMSFEQWEILCDDLLERGDITQDDYDSVCLDQAINHHEEWKAFCNPRGIDIISI